MGRTGEDGILEQTVLLLRPGTAPPAGQRAIQSADGRRALGLAYWRSPRSPWWRFRPAVLAVHEDDDQPLLFTVRRRWPIFPTREVRDAEGLRVGWVGPAGARDRLGR